MIKLYVIGDSISIHYGPYLQRCLEGVMSYARKEGEEEALLNLDNPQGANGGDSSMVLSFLKARAATGGIDADLLLLNCGLHDLKTNPATTARQIPIGQYRENLRLIVKVASNMKPELIWIRSTPINETVHNHPKMPFHRFEADVVAYNQAADDVMADARVPSIDLYTFVKNLGTDLYCDHAHYREPFREQQAAYIAGWLDAFRARKTGRSGS